MKLLIADIHGNATALRTVLEQVEEPDEIIVAGDVVGYGPQPSESVSLLREREAYVVKGNHDAALVEDIPRNWFNRHAREALEWQEDRLSSDEKAWLKNLPNQIQRDDLTVVHGSPEQPLKEYIRTERDFEWFLPDQPDSKLVVGHTHTAASAWRTSDGLEVLVGKQLAGKRLELADQPAILNPGSIGQPRDRDPRASFVQYHPDSGMVRFERIDYDIESVQNLIREAGYSDFLAQRLAKGR